MTSPTAGSKSAASIAELLNLEGKAAIVTGGAMGIGRSIAERLHEAGANVVIADLETYEAQVLATALDAKRPDSAIAVHVNVGSQPDAEVAVAAAVKHFGGLDILVNNAGIYPFATFADMTGEFFQKVLQTNLIGPFLMMKAAADQMIIQGRGGKIVNVTSVDALHPSMVGLAAYDSSKHGLWGLTKNVALELAEHGIIVNALAPGAVATPGTGMGDVPQEQVDAASAMNALGRMADPDEIGTAALFLVSGLSSYMVGSQVVVDAGMLLK